MIAHETVFAAGDITNLPENRLAIMAGLDAKLIAAIWRGRAWAFDYNSKFLTLFRNNLPKSGNRK
jgi:hypothetical protein